MNAGQGNTLVQSLSAPAKVTGANNGLHLTGKIVQLGGDLNQTTSINCQGADFALFGSAGAFALDNDNFNAIIRMGQQGVNEIFFNQNQNLVQILSRGKQRFTVNGLDQMCIGDNVTPAANELYIVLAGNVFQVHDSSLGTPIINATNNNGAGISASLGTSVAGLAIDQATGFATLFGQKFVLNTAPAARSAVSSVVVRQNSSGELKTVVGLNAVINKVTVNTITVVDGIITAIT